MIKRTLACLLAYFFVGMLLMSASSESGAQPRDANEQIVVLEHVLAQDVVGREPVGVGEQFLADGRIYSFVRVENPGPRTTLTFRWYHDGREHAVIDVNVGIAPSWRTWSSVGLEPGRWQVVLEDAHGTPLDELIFDVTN